MKAESISYKDFKSGNFEGRSKPEEHPILVFLRRNPKAFNLVYIMKTVRISASAARSMLRKLKKRGLVLHKPPFFAYKR